MKVIKRDGRAVDYDREKIRIAIIIKISQVTRERASISLLTKYKTAVIVKIPEGLSITIILSSS